MKKIIALAAVALLSACGSSQDSSVVKDDATSAAPEVAVSQDGAGGYAAVLSGDAAAKLGAALVQTPYTSAQGGLTLGCGGGICRIAVDTTKGDLSSIHRPEDEGNHDLLQVWLNGDSAKDFYLSRTSVEERFLSNDLGLKTYGKDVLLVHGETGASADISCYKKVTPHLIFLTKTSYQCVVGLSGYEAL